MDQSPLQLTDADYVSIEDALLETAKGRAFLDAYLKRNGDSSYLRLMRSIEQLHRTALGDHGLIGKLARDLSVILRQMVEVRQNCPQQGALFDLVQQAEASLLVLAESIEECRDSTPIYFNPFEASRSVNDKVKDTGKDRHAKLIGELSYLFLCETKDFPPLKQ